MTRNQELKNKNAVNAIILTNKLITELSVFGLITTPSGLVRSEDIEHEEIEESEEATIGQALSRIRSQLAGLLKEDEEP